MHKKAIPLLSLVTLLSGICSSQVHGADPSADGSGKVTSPTTAVYENSTNTIQFVLTTAQRNTPPIVVWEFTVLPEWSFTDTAENIAGTLSDGCAGASVSIVGDMITLTGCNIDEDGMYASGSFTIATLAAPVALGTYIFTNKTAGSPGTLKPISPPVANDVSINVVTSAIDTIPPAAITDLSASTGKRAGEVDLTWTAPGDDGMAGTATRYIIKYHTREITTANFGRCPDIPNLSAVPAPRPAYSPEIFTVTGLTAGVTFFAIVTEDEVPNPSEVSYSPSAAVQQGDSITVTASPLTLVADGTSTSVVTATVVGVDGNPVPEEVVTMAVTMGTGTIEPVTDNGDGTYSATYTASTTSGTETITATDLACASITTATVNITLTPRPDVITVTASPLTLVADGVSTSIVTASVIDVNGNPLSGETVTMAVTVGTGTIGPVTDNGDGTYSATYTASTTPGTETITATDTACVTIATATVDIMLTPRPDVITVTASLLTLVADGTSTSIVTATVVDINGNPLSGETVTMAVTVGTGTIGPVTDNGDGTYSATYTASVTPGTETITATDLACASIKTATVDISLVSPPVAAAIDKGIAWLISQQRAGGYWEYSPGEGEVGVTAMGALALLNYGADPYGNLAEDVAVSNALEFIVSQQKANGAFGDEAYHEVYQTSAALWALVAARTVTGDSRWDTVITDGANYLKSAQNDAGGYLGGWPYGLYEKNWWGDLSNTQYALLALKAAERAGLTTFDKASAITFVGNCQNADGGFTYQDGWSPHVDPYWVSYGSMSAAGVWSLYCCDVLDDTHPAWSRVVSGMTWLRDNVGTYQADPGTPTGQDWYYYYMMALSKAFAMYPTLAPADWYTDLSSQLIRVDDADPLTQNSNGSWGSTTSRYFEGEPYEFATVQALLALQTQATMFEGWMKVMLSSYADLHVYDPLGRHVGMNYETGEVEIEIPGATYSGPGTDPQIVTIPRLPAGSYTVDVVGKASEWYMLTVETYLGDKLVSTETCREEITEGEVKEHSVIVASVIGPLELYTDFPAPPVAATAVVNFDPDTLNLGSRGRWVTCYIEVTEGYEVEDIDLDSISLSGIDYNLEDELVDVEVDIPVDAKGPTTIGDYDGDGVPDLMIKFDRKEVADALKVSDRVGLRVEGFVGAAFFEGRATIRVIGNGDQGTGSGRPHRPREELLLNVWR